MARMFTVTADNIKTIYNGFNLNFNPQFLNHVFLYSVDGEIEILAIDDPNGCKDIYRYLKDCGENFRIIGIFSRNH